MRYYVTGTIGEDRPVSLTFKARDMSDALYQLKFFEHGLAVIGAEWEITAITTRKPRGIDFVEIN